MTVLEELDAGKKGLSEQARNVRQVSRFLDEIMRDATKAQIDRGLRLPNDAPVNHGKKAPAQIVLSNAVAGIVLPDSCPARADNAILAYALALQKSAAQARITLVSKDINLRIKAAILAFTPKTISATKPWRTPTSCRTAFRRCRPISGRNTARIRVLA